MSTLRLYTELLVCDEELGALVCVTDLDTGRITLGFDPGTGWADATAD